MSSTFNIRSFGKLNCFPCEGEFKKEYPGAKVIGVEGLAKKKEAEGLKLDGGKEAKIYNCNPNDIT